MDVNKIFQDILHANLEYKNAVARNLGIMGARDRLKNLLFTHRDLILSALSAQDNLQKKIDDISECRDMLSAELESVDAENDSLREEIKSLKAELADAYDAMNHEVQELQMQIEQQEDVPRKKANKTMTAVVE